MDGKCVVITGATTGIGRATALALGRLGASVLLVSRNRALGLSLARKLSAPAAGTTAEFIEADLSSQPQVRRAAERIRERGPVIDVLINNAGARFDAHASTPDGLERTFATNHVGHFLLTCLLLDRLTAAAGARIITLSSSAAGQARNDGRWQFGAADYDRRQAYAKSKLANLVFAFELARRLRGTSVQSMAVDPGLVATRFARNNGLLPWLKHLVSHGLKGELRSPAGGADTVVFLASTTTLPPGAPGGFFCNRQLRRGPPAAYDTDVATELWRTSVSLCALSPALGPAWRYIDPTPRLDQPPTAS